MDRAGPVHLLDEPHVPTGETPGDRIVDLTRRVDAVRDRGHARSTPARA
jgi:hypothetical protein